MRNNTNLQIEIIFNDANFVVINKPSGLLAVPGKGPENQICAVSQIRNIFPGIIDQPAVHRLDMETSGLMVIAKTKEAHRELSIAFEQKKVTKFYFGITEEIIPENNGLIKLKFRLDPNNRPYQIFDPINGKEGITQWEKLTDLIITNINNPNTEKAKKGSLIRFKPLTGRTHQLRIHSASPPGLNKPLVGDSLYGSNRENRENKPMRLHAAYLSFKDPSKENGSILNFSIEPSWKEWNSLSEEQKESFICFN